VGWLEGTLMVWRQGTYRGVCVGCAFCSFDVDEAETACIRGCEVDGWLVVRDVEALDYGFGRRSQEGQRREIWCELHDCCVE
jgi:hypothetical protein